MGSSCVQRIIDQELVHDIRRTNGHVMVRGHLDERVGGAASLIEVNPDKD